MNSDPELDRLDPITEQIIGCAIEVHRHLGAGLLEHTYETAMCLERCTRLRVGLLINFNNRVLRTGIRRFVL